MRIFKRIGFGLFFIGFLTVTGWTQIDPAQITPIDPNVRIGKLANGLTYYIRKNSLPEKRVELRLVVNAGSILEDEDQQGLAHFMEHMNFNGTKHFPKNELVSYLQTIGVQFGADLNAYTFKDRVDKLVRKGNAEPPIKGFSLSGREFIDSTNGKEKRNDSTSIILSQPYCFLLFCENFSTPVRDWQKDFEELISIASQKGIPAYIVTASLNEAAIALRKTPFSNLQVFECDFTAIRTAARTNPCLYLLKQGTVINKWSYKKISQAKGYLPR